MHVGTAADDHVGVDSPPEVSPLGLVYVRLELLNPVPLYLGHDLCLGKRFPGRSDRDGHHLRLGLPAEPVDGDFNDIRSAKQPVDAVALLFDALGEQAWRLRGTLRQGNDFLVHFVQQVRRGVLLQQPVDRIPTGVEIVPISRGSARGRARERPLRLASQAETELRERLGVENAPGVAFPLKC